MVFKSACAIRLHQIPLPPRYAGTVWLDANDNGLQDSGESGLAGILVELRDSAGALVDSTTTDFSGGYSFNVVAGDYRVAFQRPLDLVFSDADQGGNDEIDSDVIDLVFQDPDYWGETDLFTLAAEQSLDRDAGLVDAGT